MTSCQHTCAAQLARHFATLTGDDRTKAAQEAVIQHGGTFVPAMASGNWGPHYAELSLLSISHTGDTTEAAVANWIKAALRAEKYVEEAA
jgi:hypothetical protein